MTPADLDIGLIYPPQSEIFETELHAAVRIAEVIFDRGLTDVPRPNNIEIFIRSQVYEPDYKSLL